MPHVDIKCYAGRTYAQKKILAAKITRDIAEIFETSEDSVSIAIHDIPPENWEPYLQACESASPEDRLILTECMKLLSDEERQIVILHAVAGFKHRETAKLLELPLSTVLSKYNRAMKKLKNHIGKEY